MTIILCTKTFNSLTQEFDRCGEVGCRGSGQCYWILNIKCHYATRHTGARLPQHGVELNQVTKDLQSILKKHAKVKKRKKAGQDAPAKRKKRKVKSENPS